MQGNYNINMQQGMTNPNPVQGTYDPNIQPMTNNPNPVQGTYDSNVQPGNYDTQSQPYPTNTQAE